MKRDRCLLLLAPAVLLSLFLVLAEGGLPRYQDRLTALPVYRAIATWMAGAAPTSACAPAEAGQVADFFPAEQREQLDRLLGTACTGQARSAEPLRTFGFGLRSLWLVDGLLFISLFLIGLSALIRPDLQARIQGPVTLIYAVVVIIGAVLAILVALAATFLMITVLFAFPFGTIVYLIRWGSFDRAGAAAVLGVFFIIKLGIGASVVAANPEFLANTGLAVIFLAALAANWLVSFLQGLPPGFLVSIADAVAGIVVAMLGLILAVILLVSAVKPSLRAFQP